jgi:hypothetical protein
VALVRTNASEERIATIIRVKKNQQGTNNFSSNWQILLLNVFQLLITANVFRKALILFTLMMEAIYSSESSTLTRAMGRGISKDGILLCIFLC